MKDQPANGIVPAGATGALACRRGPGRLPGRTGQATVREKAHTREGGAIASARRRLP